MKRAITLAGFEATFVGNPDPWNTFAARDEARKRRAIVHALGPAKHGRLLELASGNGSNSRSLAAHALRADITDGAPTAVHLTARHLADLSRARVSRLVLPGRFPAARYDAIVAAEIFYYLTPRALDAVAREIARRLRPGGRLILAHHHLRFADAAVAPAGVHAALRRALPFATSPVGCIRTERWRVETLIRRPEPR
jgi:cyclopropane fatty-acyl-phospholipid synthase-like methyltransferase